MLILFTSPYRNSLENLKYMMKITPNNKGIWKNIKGTSDKNNFDYIVILDNIDKEIENLGENYFKKLINYNYDKIIHFQRENEGIIKFEKQTWYNKKIFPYIKKKFMNNKFKYTFIFPSFLNKTYDELKLLNYKEKSKILSSITSYKINKKYSNDYINRVNFLIKYSKANKCDIYGKGWPFNILGNNYKGELDSYHKKIGKTSKFDGLIDYHYSIALENFSNENSFSEKLTDCILCWTIPIYSGNPNITHYLPEKSYHLINLNDKDVINQVNKIIENNQSECNIKALNDARELILDKYNIWEQIYQIINDYDNFTKEYSL